ncbi:hypothetical protein OESDEN_05147 [Oesophagostomum dentatum]|uniref:Uncharacterized protein n=1 Tax=Oesophagostomum dentatum TaxID=61180 RepID=A0A0B1THN0_OESDE|nr:hypothetical protein OESDEN_05147 [Oesophagostomum dentatum]
MTQIQCPNYYRLLEADLEKEDSNTENYAELIDSLEEEMGYPSFEYHHIGGVYDIHRELIHNMTDKQPEFVFKTWPQYGNRSTMELVEELERSRTMVQFNSAQKAKVKLHFSAEFTISNL